MFYLLHIKKAKCLSMSCMNYIYNCVFSVLWRLWQNNAPSLQCWCLFNVGPTHLPGSYIWSIKISAHVHYFIHISYHIISYHIISCHIISYHIISYHIISYHIISYHIISYIIFKIIPKQNILLYEMYSKHCSFHRALVSTKYNFITKALY